MLSKDSRSVAARIWLAWHALAGRAAGARHGFRYGGRSALHCRAGALASRALAGAALLLAGAVAGFAAGQAVANRAAHRTGACAALNMAATLGYLDAEQQRRVRHALSTAVNPEADLFTGSRPSVHEPCGAGANM